MAVSKYAEVGSKGPGARVINQELASMAMIVGVPIPEGFKIDDDLGPKAGELMATLQKYFELEVAGGFGPQMREEFKEQYDVDVEALLGLTAGETDFVQPDGSVITWSPETDFEDLGSESQA